MREWAATIYKMSATPMLPSFEEEGGTCP